MFVLRESSTFDWIVKAKVPQGKKRVGVSFTATFNQLSQDLVDELIINDDTRDNRKFLELALASFDGLDVQDGEGNEVTDNDEKNAIILKNTLFLVPIMKAYNDGSSGHAGKN